MLYNVTHTTRYRYEAPVSQCLNEVRLTPRAISTQRVQETSLHVVPVPAFVYGRKDYFGNAVSTFAVFENHDELTATARSLVEVIPRVQEADSLLRLEEARRQIAARTDEESLRASEFVYESPYVPLSPALAAYAREVFDESGTLIEVVKNLSHRIHSDFKYEPLSTSIDIP